jgi:predicted kinase
MKEPAILYLIVGLPGAGKTTKARQLEVEASALRLTPAEWMKSLFGRNDPATRDVLEGRLIWIALRALQLHTNVILDFGFWSKDERSSLRWIAKQIGAKSQVIYLPLSLLIYRKSAWIISMGNAWSSPQKHPAASGLSIGAGALHREAWQVFLVGASSP